MRVLASLLDSKRRWWTASCVTMLVVGFCLLRAWWMSPGQRIAQFSRALSQSDPVAMLSVCDRREIERLGITPEKLRAILADASQSPGGVILSNPTVELFNPSQTRYNRAINATLADRRGNPLKDTEGRPAVVYLYAYNTKDGWKVGLSEFLRSLSIARLPERDSYAHLCERHRIAAEILNPTDTEWRTVARR